jgi:hypothetical protein
MGTKGFFMRMLPFLATFTLGIFIASFFVSISAPRLGNRAPGHKYYKMKKLRVENERLRNENLRLRNELESLQNGSNAPVSPAFHELNVDTYVDSVPPPPPAPVAPRSAK